MARAWVSPNGVVHALDSRGRCATCGRNDHPTCDHSESLYGRCVACGLTWEGQARHAALMGGAS